MRYQNWVLLFWSRTWKYDGEDEACVPFENKISLGNGFAVVVILTIILNVGLAGCYRPMLGSWFRLSTPDQILLQLLHFRSLMPHSQAQLREDRGLGRSDNRYTIFSTSSSTMEVSLWNI